MASSRVSKLLKNSRTEILSFMELTKDVSDIPENQLIDYFEVCHFHLRKPVTETLFRNGKDGAAWITLSLTGISAVASDVAEGALAGRMAACWPDVFNWAKAIVLEFPFYGLFESFCSAIGNIFNLTFLVSDSLLQSDDVYDLAIDLWKGKETSGVDYHTELPLFCCLSSESTRHVERLLERSGYQDMEVVEKIVRRMNRAAASNPIEPDRIIASVCLLGRLIESPHLISWSALCSDAPRSIASNLTRLLVDKDESSLHQNAIFTSLRFLDGYIQGSPDNISGILRYGFLSSLLDSASVYPVEDSEDVLSSCLEDVLPSLVYDHVLLSFIGGFSDIFRGNHTLTQLLDKASANFRTSWKIFESVLLEQLLLYHLFEKGYARERGACANQSCHKLADRRDFKKCAGCGFTLYCSKDCQKKDWSHHRRGCKEIDEDYESDYNLNTNQFPRRLATAQINRYWSNILSLAEKQTILEKNIGVRIDYGEYPFKIGVFDYEILVSEEARNTDLIVQRNLLPSESDRPYHTMVANEVFRRSQEGHRCVMLIVIHSDGRKLPSLAYLEDVPPSSLERHLEDTSTVITSHTHESHYTDGLGNKLSPRENDTLGKAMQLARARLRSDFESFWEYAEYHDVVEEVLNV